MEKIMYWLKVVGAVFIANFVVNIIGFYLDFGFKGPTEPMFAGPSFLVNAYFAFFVTLFTALAFFLAFIIVSRGKRFDVMRVGRVALVNQMIVIALFFTSIAVGFSLGSNGALLLGFISGLILTSYFFKRELK